MIERKNGILEVPIHLYVDKNEKGLVSTDKLTAESDELSMADISKFWHAMDKGQFDPKIRDNNTDEISLFTFDIINSLGEK